MGLGYPSFLESTGIGSIRPPPSDTAKYNHNIIRDAFSVKKR